MSLWYTEEENGLVRYGYKVNQVLFREQSDFQLVEVIDTIAYGRMLLLDGFVMTTDRDEFVYHEMISHVPLCRHENPSDIVVIGGGDGGTVRELLKHDCRKITLCEIDQIVVDVSKEFFPSIACGLNDPRVEVKIADGVAYLNQLKNKSCDIIIIDSTDPIGPGF